MILDGHIHIEEGPVNYAGLKERMEKAGASGGILISMPPDTFSETLQRYSAEERLRNLFDWKQEDSELYPFYWIDPLEDDAAAQVELACEMGVMGFKIICDRFYPGDSRAMKIYEAIAAKNKPLLFHSGILWDGKDSSRYNRPSEFEALLGIDKLKFSLAHVSWPWCDECIAVYGKFLNAYSRRPELSVEMFIDTTPGTPAIYREGVLTKLFTIGYDVQNNIIFGSDCNTNEYNFDWVNQWVARDNEIYNKIELDKDVADKVYSQNLKRFLGISSVRASRKVLKPGE